jgi:hypothetical protein
MSKNAGAPRSTIGSARPFLPRADERWRHGKAGIEGDAVAL